MTGPRAPSGTADSGAVNWAQYTWEGAAIPLYTELPVETIGAERWRVPLLVTTGTSLLVSGTFYALAAGSQARWEEPSTPIAEFVDGPDLGVLLGNEKLSVSEAVALFAGRRSSRLYLRREDTPFHRRSARLGR